MSLQEDFDQFKAGNPNKGVKEYIRLIWEETELAPSHFEDLYSFDDFYSIREILDTSIQNIEGITPFRRSMYLKFLAELEKNEQQPMFNEWLGYLDAYIEFDETKREYLAKFMTRVLRGELCRPHRTPQDALNVLKGPRRPVWEQTKLKLEKLCGTLGI